MGTERKEQMRTGEQKVKNKTEEKGRTEKRTDEKGGTDRKEQTRKVKQKEKERTDEKGEQKKEQNR